MMKQDILGRTKFVNSIVDFINVLSEGKRGCCFAIDGKWGTGKTYVLDMLEEELNQIQSEDTADNRYFVFHYNSWEYDYYDEPLVAIVASMQDEVENKESIWNREVDKKIQAGIEVAKTEVKKMVGSLAEKHIGVNFVNVIDAIRKVDQENEEKKESYDDFYNFKKAMSDVRTSMGKIAEEKTIVLVVDELDRCMPAYAIKVIERLHHIFEKINNIVVIIAVDSEQLDSSIKTIYGEKTNPKDYMKKIIDITFKLDTGEISLGIYKKYEKFFPYFKRPDDSEKELIEKTFSTIWAGVDMRTQEKSMAKIETLHSLISDEEMDIAVAMLEIFAIRYYDVSGDGKLLWILQMDSFINNKNRDSILGEKGKTWILDFREQAFLPMEQSAWHRERLNDNLQGRVLWLIDQVHGKGEKYYINNEGQYQKEKKCTKRFSELIKIVE